MAPNGMEDNREVDESSWKSFPLVIFAVSISSFIAISGGLAISAIRISKMKSRPDQNVDSCTQNSLKISKCKCDARIGHNHSDCPMPLTSSFCACSVPSSFGYNLSEFSEASADTKRDRIKQSESEMKAGNKVHADDCNFFQMDGEILEVQKQNEYNPKHPRDTPHKKKQVQHESQPSRHSKNHRPQTNQQPRSKTFHVGECDKQFSFAPVAFSQQGGSVVEPNVFLPWTKGPNQKQNHQGHNYNSLKTTLVDINDADRLNINASTLSHTFDGRVSQEQQHPTSPIPLRGNTTNNNLKRKSFKEQLNRMIPQFLKVGSDNNFFNKGAAEKKSPEERVNGVDEDPFDGYQKVCFNSMALPHF